MAVVVSKPEHEVVYQELIALVTKHAVGLKAIEILAIAANMVGKLVAMQDQRKTSPTLAMEVVAKNIETGNAQVLSQLGQHGGTA